MIETFTYPEEFTTGDGVHRLSLAALRPDRSSAIYQVEGPAVALHRVSRQGEMFAEPAIYVLVPYVEVGPALVGPALLDGDFRGSFTNWTDVLMSTGDLVPWTA